MGTLVSLPCALTSHNCSHNRSAGNATSKYIIHGHFVHDLTFWTIFHFAPLQSVMLVQGASSHQENSWGGGAVPGHGAEGLVAAGARLMQGEKPACGRAQMRLKTGRPNPRAASTPRHNADGVSGLRRLAFVAKPGNGCPRWPASLLPVHQLSGRCPRLCGAWGC